MSERQADLKTGGLSLSGTTPPPASAGPGSPASSLKLFSGFVTLLTGLILRPRRRAWRQPLLCLVGGESSGRTTYPELISRLLSGPQRAVPHLRVRADDGQTLAELLHLVHEGLTSGRFAGPAVRLRRLALLERIMAEDLSDIQSHRRSRVLARRLAHPEQQGLSRLGEIADRIGGRISMAWVLVSVPLGPMLRWLPGYRTRRWFTRQRFAAEESSNDFFRFAVRLTKGQRAFEDPDQVDLLLTNALLHDVWSAYRDRPWNLKGRRRTAAPVLLIEHSGPGDAGYRLLWAVNRVRNETRLSDPLLVISHGSVVPPEGIPVAAAAAGDVIPLDGAEEALAAWRQRFTPKATQHSGDIDWEKRWYLRIQLPDENLDALGSNLRSIVAPVPPRSARGRVQLAALAAAVLAVLSLLSPRIVADVVAYRAGCNPLPHVNARISVTYLDKQCIGYSDDQGQLLGEATKVLGRLERDVFRQNREAMAHASRRSNRPFVTLVYLTTLTRPDSLEHEESFIPQRWGLKGLAIAQRKVNKTADNDPNSPYLRILVANTGYEGRHADVAVDRLEKLAHDDPSVIGALVSIDSRPGSTKILERLSTIGLPTMTTTMSADQIGGASNSHLQLATTNHSLSKLIHRYVVEALHRKDIWNFVSYGARGKAAERDDLYVATLAKDLQARFPRHYTQTFWNNGDLSAACSDRFHGVVVFGGRFDDFAAFLQKLASDCEDHLPKVIADDSVARFMATEDLRERVPSGLSLAYASKKRLPCDLLKQSQQSVRRDFADDSGCTDDTSEGVDSGNWVAHTYDAVNLWTEAVHNYVTVSARSRLPDGRWNPEQIDPLQVFNQIRQQTQRKPYSGVTGPIQFRPDGTVKGRQLQLFCARDVRYAFRPEVPSLIGTYGSSYPEDGDKKKMEPCPPSPAASS